jgi:hypothetical protein
MNWWWWSEQFCLFTVGAWATFLTTKGTSHPKGPEPVGDFHNEKNDRDSARNHIRGCLYDYWSAGRDIHRFQPLLLCSVVLPTRRFATPPLWHCILASLITVALSPHATQQTFFIEELARHGAFPITTIWRDTNDYITSESVN